VVDAALCLTRGSVSSAKHKTDPSPFQRLIRIGLSPASIIPIFLPPSFLFQSGHSLPFLRHLCLIMVTSYDGFLLCDRDNPPRIIMQSLPKSGHFAAAPSSWRIASTSSLLTWTWLHPGSSLAPSRVGFAFFNTLLLARPPCPPTGSCSMQAPLDQAHVGGAFLPVASQTYRAQRRNIPVSSGVKKKANLI
jgi:hypothetical protein